MTRIIFDAGAHTGESIKHWYKIGYDVVVAIEPQRLLCDDISRSFPEVIVVNAALWDSNGTTTMYSGSYTTLATVVKKRTISGRFSKYGWSHETCVDTVTLDSLIDMYGLPTKIKMDIEGAEKYALRGLSHVVEMVSFEYVAESIGDAVECVNILSDLSDYRFTVRRGESTTENIDVSGEEAKRTLVRLSKNRSNIWGMVDAHTEDL